MSSTEAQDPAQRPTEPDPPYRARTRNLAWLAVITLIGLGGWGAWWALYGNHFETTDDAYVSGDMVQITSDVAGSVIDVDVDDTQSVDRDQLLVRLDPADARIAMQRAEAELARTVRSVRGLFAQGDQLRARIEEREAELARAVADVKRRTDLVAEGAVSAEELSHSEDAVTRLRASLAAAREQLAETTAQVDGTTLTTHPQVLAAEAAVRDAALALHRTRITAPVAGVVARRAVQLGQRVAPGAPLMTVVPLERVWVDANFKEVQLTDMRVGQPVELTADVYGDDVVYHGHLAGVSAGTGGAFALLPAQNASGNWIKIVQRVPVRIALDPDEVRAHPLRVGMSMHASVDVHETGGEQVTSRVRAQPRPERPSLADDPEVEQRIQRIVAENAGDAASGPALAAGRP